MHVIQVSCVADRLRRPAADLLDVWPTLGAIAHAVGKAGADVTVVLSSHRDAVYEREGVTYRFVAERWSGGGAVTAYVTARLAQVVRAQRPDVVHVNGFGFPFHTRALCALGVPVLVQHHADSPDGRMRALKRWGLAKISAAAFTSGEQAQAFVARAYFKRSLPVFEIPESSTRFQDGDVAAARCATGVYGDPAVLWVGHLNENKDPLTILDGFAHALRNLPEAQLWYCYRDAPLLDRIEARLARDRTLAAHVHLLGPAEHAKVEHYCRAADFFMLGSRQESCGYAVLEALACGATPIVTDIPAFRAITGRGKVGALCEPGNAQAFSAALERFARLPKQSLRTRAIRYFREELSFPVVGRKLAAAYEAIIADHATTSIARR
jgi:glycosyltransferase involved in cell wall biosynthesis